jgi:hypothetical protein
MMQLSVSRPVSQLVGTDLNTLTIYQQLHLTLDSVDQYHLYG